MFKNIRKPIQEFGDLIDWLLRIGAVLAMLTPLIVAIRQWVKLDNTDIWLIGIGLFGVFLVILSLVLRWLTNRSVRSIPPLLEKMDEKMKCLIGTATPAEDKMQQFLIDATEMWNIDIDKVRFAYNANDLNGLRGMVKEFETRPSPFPHNSPQPFSVISNFLQTLWGLMKTDEIGIDSIKDNEYKQLEKRFNSLRRRLHDSRNIRNLDRYLIWWNGQNSYQLFLHYGQNSPYTALLAPAKMKAVMPQFEYLLQVAVNEYLGYVKDGVYGKKADKEEWKPVKDL